MTDNFEKDIDVPSKEIIIDGVDVSGCEFAPKEIGWCNNGNLSSYCKDNPNCYYKQLKRKEQKLEQISKAYEQCKESRLKMFNKAAELEQECEKLKEEMFAHFHKTGEVPALLGFTIYDIANLVKENKALNQYKKSKQALTEIKEIAEDQRDVLESMRIDIAEQILNKISEVLKDE